MLGTIFREETIQLAKKRQHEVATLAHGCKILLNNDEVVALLEMTDGFDVLHFEKAIENILNKYPKYKTDKPILSTSIEGITKAAVVGAGGSANVTPLHLLIELTNTIIDEEGEEYEAFSDSCDNPYDVRLELKAMLSGETIQSLEKFEDEKDERTDKPVNKGYNEKAANLVSLYYDHSSNLDKVINVTNTTSGKVVAVVAPKRGGKTAVVEALTYWVHNTADNRAQRSIIELDMDTIVKTSFNRGIMEQIVINAIEDAKRTNSILLIDNIHYLHDTCKDCVILPYLVNGASAGLTIVCTVPPTKYTKIFGVVGYESCVERIDLTEPNPESRRKIIQLYADKLSNEHHILFKTNALDELNSLIEQHLKKNALGNAMIVMERCCIIHDKDLVTVDVVRKAFAEYKGTSLDALSSGKIKDLSNLPSKLKSKIYGQDEAIDSVAQKIQIANLGLKLREEQPRAAIMLLGASGVGKTETTEIIAQELNIPKLRLDMGEYKESHTISKLLGAPPGYIGNDKGDGVIAEFVSANPNGMILFDEIEKASPNIFDLLLGILDKGTLLTNTLKEVDLSGTIIFFTSNCGAEQIQNSNFGLVEKTNKKQAVNRNTFERFFKPEFRNRLSAIIDYNTLTHDDTVKITTKLVEELIHKIQSNYGIKVTVAPEAIDFISKKYFTPDLGARPIERGVETEISERIATALLSSTSKLKGLKVSSDGSMIKVD